MGAQNLNHWPTREVPSLSFCTGVGQGDSPKPSTNLPGNLGAHSLGQGLGFPLCEMSRRWSQRPCWLGLSLSDSFIPRAPFPALMTGGWEGTTLPAPRGPAHLLVTKRLPPTGLLSRRQRVEFPVLLTAYGSPCLGKRLREPLIGKVSKAIGVKDLGKTACEGQFPTGGQETLSPGQSVYGRN